MSLNEQVYLGLLRDVLNRGERRSDRTGTGTVSLFGEYLGFDLEECFPLLTTKKVNYHAVLHELLWFLSGDTNTKYLNDNGVHIWNNWADEHGRLGKVYGHQWRNFSDESYAGGVDQITKVVESIKTDPFSRRHIVTAWNPQDLNDCALPPCHVMFQFYVSKDKELSLQWYQRSADVFLGLPFNIASYATLVHMVAHVTGLKVGSLSVCIGDAHLYENHLEQAEEQLSRKPRKVVPELRIIGNHSDIFTMKAHDFELTNYHPLPAIKAPISV